MTLGGSDELLGSDDPSDTHDVFVVAPSGCGKTALILCIILFFWNAFNNITQEPPPEDDDWLLLK
jgi:hypothetical protein